MSATRIKAIKARYPGIEEAPFLFIQSHGGYDLTRYQMGELEFMLKVPEKTIVIETGKVGEDCFFTNITADIIRGLSKRDSFMDYIIGSYYESDTPEEREKMMNALAICTVYKPGDNIVNRLLTLDAGRGVRRTNYDTLGFLEVYDGGSKPVFAELERRLTENRDNIASYKDFFSTPPDDHRADGFRIFFFLSCGGVVNPDVHSREAWIKEIDDTQNAARAGWITQFKGSANLTYITRSPYAASYTPPNAGAGGAGGTGGRRVAKQSKRKTRGKKRHTRKLKKSN